MLSQTKKKFQMEGMIIEMFIDSLLGIVWIGITFI